MNDIHTRLQAAVAAQMAAVNAQIEQAYEVALSKGVGLLVLTRHGLPVAVGPNALVPEREAHWVDESAVDTWMSTIIREED